MIIELIDKILTWILYPFLLFDVMMGSSQKALLPLTKKWIKTCKSIISLRANAIQTDHLEKQITYLIEIK